MQMSAAPNSASYNSVLNAMARAAPKCTDRRLVSSALAVFRRVSMRAEARMSSQRLVTFFTVAYANLLSSKARALRREMQAAPGVAPDITAFQLLITILEHAGDWQQALVIYEVMHARVLPLTISDSAAVLVDVIPLPCCPVFASTHRAVMACSL